MLIIKAPEVMSAYETVLSTGVMAALRDAVKKKVGHDAYTRSTATVTVVAEHNYHQDTLEYYLICRKAGRTARTLEAAAEWIATLVTLEA